MSYNGYTNWETWNVALWLNNDEGLYLSYFKTGKTWTAREAEDTVRELMPDGTPDMDGSDGGYAAVNWEEVAGAMSDE